MSETVTCCREWAVYVDNAGTAILVHHAYNEAGEERVRLPQGEHEHCRKCGAWFTLVDGSVEVGPSQDRLLAALYREICLYGQCPGELQDFACPQEHETDKHGPCWLIYYGLSATYVEAAELWRRMEEAAAG